MYNLSRRRRSSILALLVVGSLIAVGCRLEILDDPNLVHEGHILTRPFEGSSTRMFDGEGLAYVPDDNALWLADDNGDALYEVDLTTGELTSTVDLGDLAATPRFGGGGSAGSDRAGDLEAVAYDPVNDHLYAVSASCCTSSAEPTIFRLARTGPSGDFTPEFWQPLEDDYTAASATPSGQLYLSEQDDIHSYDFPSNTEGPPFSIPGISSVIYGLGFSVDGKDLFIADSSNTVARVDWASRTIVPDYDFNVSSEGIGEARAVELIGDRLFVQDGDDTMSSSNPLKYAVHIFSIDGDEQSPSDPVASFNATPAGGGPPLDIDFESTSFDPDGVITGTAWAFGDGTLSSNPTVTHQYASPGVYQVHLLVIDDAQHWSLASSSVTVE